MDAERRGALRERLRPDRSSASRLVDTKTLRHESALAGLLHRWGMLLLVVSLPGWLWGLSLWSGAQQKRQLLEDRGGELALMANAVAQHTSGMLRAVESDLQRWMCGSARTPAPMRCAIRASTCWSTRCAAPGMD